MTNVMGPLVTQMPRELQPPQSLSLELLTHLVLTPELKVFVSFWMLSYLLLFSCLKYRATIIYSDTDQH